MFWAALGITAAGLTMFSFVPQIIKSLKTKSVNDLSLFTLFQFLCGSFLWTLYGAHLNDKIIISANVITFVIISVLIFLYFSYGKFRKEN